MWKLTNTEYQGREPERVDCVRGGAMGVTEGELQTSGSHRGKESRDSRQVEQAMCTVFLCESDCRDA